MFQVSKRHPGRRVVAAARALGQGLLAVALIALAAFVLLPSAHAAQASVPVTFEDQTFAGNASVAGAPLQLDGVGLRAASIDKVYLAGLSLPTRAATLPGVDLYAPLLGIVVGDRPVDPKMKAGMPGAAG